MRAVPAGMTIPMRTALAATITAMNTSTIILTTAALAATITAMNTNMNILMAAVPADMTTVILTAILTDIAADADMITETAVAAVTITA